MYETYEIINHLTSFFMRTQAVGRFLCVPSCLPQKFGLKWHIKFFCLKILVGPPPVAWIWWTIYNEHNAEARKRYLVQLWNMDGSETAACGYLYLLNLELTKNDILQIEIVKYLPAWVVWNSLQEWQISR